jgi:small-conductance mechanosensitive channel
MEALKNVATQDWIIAGAFIVGGFLLGLIFEMFAVRALKMLVKNTSWEWDDVIIKSIKKVAILWFTVAGLYMASNMTISFEPDVKILIRKVIFALMIFSLAIVIARIMSGFIRLFSKRTTGGLPASSLLTNFASLIIIVSAIVLILQNLGISITPLITAMGIGGLAVALALQDTLSNLFAGFQIIVTRQLRPGDFVMLDSGENGYVTDVKWRNTTIKSRRSSQLYIVPNAKIASSIITNYNLPAKWGWLRVRVGVAYDSDLKHVEKVTQAVADSVIAMFYADGSEEKPVIRFKEFGDSSITVQARLPVKVYDDQFEMKSEYIKALHVKYNEENITIPFPIRTVYNINADEEVKAED